MEMDMKTIYNALSHIARESKRYTHFQVIPERNDTFGRHWTVDRGKFQPLRFWTVRYRYPGDSHIYQRVVQGFSRDAAVVAFHSCGAHSDDVVSVTPYGEKPRA
jgi:hypothetical protein